MDKAKNGHKNKLLVKKSSENVHLLGEMCNFALRNQ